MAQLQVLNACEIGGSITIVINDDWTSYEREKILDSFTLLHVICLIFQAQG